MSKKSWCIGLLCCVLCLTSVQAQNADIDLLRKVNLSRNTQLDPTFRIVSSSVTPISIAVPITELTVGLITQNKKLKTDAAVDVASLLGAYAVTYSIKYTARRKRPYVTHPDIQNLAIEHDPSFPSGHTTNAFSTATSLSMAFRKWYVVVPSYAWAGAVSYSRLHMGVHYPSDVLVGAAIGSGSAWLCYKGQKWLARKKIGTRKVPQR